MWICNIFYQSCTHIHTYPYISYFILKIRARQFCCIKVYLLFSSIVLTYLYLIKELLFITKRHNINNQICLLFNYQNGMDYMRSVLKFPITRYAICN